MSKDEGPYAGWLGDSAAEQKLSVEMEKIARHFTAMGQLMLTQALCGAVESGLREPTALLQAARQGMIEEAARLFVDPGSLYQKPRLAPFDPQLPESMRAFCGEIDWWLDVAGESIVSVTPAVRRSVEDGVKSLRELVDGARTKLEAGQRPALDLYKAYDLFQRAMQAIESAEARREFSSQNASGPRMRRQNLIIKAWLRERATRAPEASLADLVKLPGKKPRRPNWRGSYIWHRGTKIIAKPSKGRRESVSFRTMERHLREIRKPRS